MSKDDRGARETSSYAARMTESVIVLGGGLSGCSAGYALAQAGLRVCVIERAPALGGLGGSFERGLLCSGAAVLGAA